MRKLRIIVSMVAISLSVISCASHKTEEAFVASDDVRLQVGRADQFVYDPLTCQLGFNRSTRTFSAHTDTMSDYFIATFSEVPASLGQKLSADINWTTHSNVLSRKKLTLEVVRLEGDKVWLWSQQGKIGLTVRTLE